MRLDEKAWILSRGLTKDWEYVSRFRVRGSVERLPALLKEYEREAPKTPRRALHAKGLKWFAGSKGAARERLASHPAFDYWLYLWDKHFRSGAPSGEENWRLQFGLFQGFAASLALDSRGPATFHGTLDPDAHLHLYGSPFFVSFAKEHELKDVAIKVAAAGLELAVEGGPSVKVPRAALTEDGPDEKPFGAAVLHRTERIAGAMRVDTCGFLSTQGVVMHGLASPTRDERKRFAEVLRVALAHIQDRDPGLHAEMTDLVVSLIPLVNPKDYGSVSSSYVNMRGMIALSHAEDPLLQAETLIHEFCHQKMNQLLLVDAVLLPGQAGQVFFSPWRPDARRLRGLILGAHAFLNVAAYLIKSLSREEYELREKISVMGNVARRLFEVDDALRSTCGYGEFTEFGSRFMLGMCRETTKAFHAIQWYPPELVAEARAAAAKHRENHALPLTSLYKPKDFAAKVDQVRFKQGAAS